MDELEKKYEQLMTNYIKLQNDYEHLKKKKKQK